MGAISDNGWAVFNAASALPNLSTLLQNQQFFSHYWNLKNHLELSDSHPGKEQGILAFMNEVKKVLPAPATTTTPPVTVQVTPNPTGPPIVTATVPSGAGLLDGKIFGIDKKLLLIGAGLYFLLSK